MKPTDWIVRASGKDYAAESLQMLAEWLKNGQIPDNSQILNPNTQKWMSLEEVVSLVTSEIIVTTTHNIDGYEVKRYISIESVEIVIGTGLFSEVTSSFSDMFGKRSIAFEQKLQYAKWLAMAKLKLIALQRRGNAVIGVDLDYTEFSDNRVGLILNGTIVEIESQKTSQR